MVERDRESGVLQVCVVRRERERVCVWVLLCCVEDAASSSR